MILGRIIPSLIAFNVLPSHFRHFCRHRRIEEFLLNGPILCSASIFCPCWIFVVSVEIALVGYRLPFNPSFFASILAPFSVEFKGGSPHIWKRTSDVYFWYYADLTKNSLEISIFKDQWNYRIESRLGLLFHHTICFRLIFPVDKNRIIHRGASLLETIKPHRNNPLVRYQLTR